MERSSSLKAGTAAGVSTFEVDYQLQLSKDGGGGGEEGWRGEGGGGGEEGWRGEGGGCWAGGPQC